jgi:hypothetical protein
MPDCPFGGRKLTETIDVSEMKPTKAAAGRARVLTTVVCVRPSAVAAVTSMVET